WRSLSFHLLPPHSAVPRLPLLSHTQFLCLFAGPINADPRRNTDVTVIPAIAGPGVSRSMPCSESGHPLGVLCLPSARRLPAVAVGTLDEIREAALRGSEHYRAS